MATVRGKPVFGDAKELEPGDVYLPVVSELGQFSSMRLPYANPRRNYGV